MNIEHETVLWEKEVKKTNISKETIKNYQGEIKRFLIYFEQKQTVEEITLEEINNYVQQWESTSTQCSKINSIKSFYKLTQDTSLNLKELNKPKRSEKVMKIIDKGLLLKMIKKIGNSKHKAFIALAFSTGMQLNEIINLEIEDIHFERDEILVNNNNSKKIRILPLSRFTKGILLSYINKYHPTKYLFNGQSNPQYSKKSALNIVQKYIGHNCNFHVIRNSSVVALLKAGADVKRVQKHLGHASKKTTKTFEKGTKTGNLKELLPI